MLQEVAFAFTQTSYSDIHSVIPDLASFTFSTALSSPWAPAILTTLLFLSISGMLPVPSSGYVLLCCCYQLSILLISLLQISLPSNLYICFHNFRILLNCDFFIKSFPDYFNKLSSQLLDVCTLFAHLLFLRLFISTFFFSLLQYQVYERRDLAHLVHCCVPSILWRLEITGQIHVEWAYDSTTKYVNR